MSALPIEADAPFDAVRAQAYAERFLKALNDSAMVLMTSIGHRTGLFDAMENAPPLTSDELAEKSGLAERYVREWLAVMVMSYVVEYESATRRYRLPPEHAAFLTRASVPNNLAATAQFIPGIGSVESMLVECMRSGGGLPYDAYHRFHEVMAEDSGQTVVAALFDSILPLVPDLEERLEAGISVADVGCGSGRAMLALAERFPKSRFIGFDLCEEPIATANRQVREKGLRNIRFEQRDLSRRPLEGPYDLITAFDAVHDQRDPAGLLRSIHGALAPTGVFLMQDIAGSSQLEKNFDHPVAALLYAVSTAHCTCVSLGQGGPGLGTMWGEELAEQMLREAGFREISCERLPHDFMNVYFIAR